MPKWVDENNSSSAAFWGQKVVPRPLLHRKEVFPRTDDALTAVSADSNVFISKEQLAFFRGQGLEAAGDVFVKTSRLQRPKKKYAELRGSTIVVFHKTTDGTSAEACARSVVMTLLVSDYDVEAVQKNRGQLQIYIRPKQAAEYCFIYITTSSHSEKFNAWRHGLSRAMNAAVPDLQSLTVESVIGKGGGGEVFAVHWKNKKSTYALKVVDKAQAFESPKSFLHVASERYLMEKAGKHPFLLQLQFAFQTDTRLFIGTRLCSGGDLASYMRHKGKGEVPGIGCDAKKASNSPQQKRKPSERLTEAQARPIVCEIILGLENLHSRGIVYRDLKLENIFIDDTGHIKIGDLGLAKYLPESKTASGRVQTSSICGTRNYLPPEMLLGRLYSFQADLWCLGVLIYRMVAGCFPFDAMRTRDLFYKVKRHELHLPLWLSVELSQLLRGLLRKDPQKRLTMEQVKAHPFFRKVVWENVLHKRNGPSVPNVQSGGFVKEALENFKLGNLQDVSINEGATREKDVRAEQDSPTSLDTMMIGFEKSCSLAEDDDPQPLQVLQKRGSLFPKLMPSIWAIPVIQSLCANQGSTQPPPTQCSQMTRNGIKLDDEGDGKVTVKN